MTATLQLVSGTGECLTARGFRLSNYPWVYIGGTVDTIVSGTITYYGIDNSSEECIRLGCYKDITLSTVYADFEDYCDGVRIQKRKLDGYTTTVTVTEDLVDLRYLRWFLRQSSGMYDSDAAVHEESLLVGDLITRVVPVLFEHHYMQDASADDQWIGVLMFECELSLGDIEIDPTEGYSGELTIDVRKSDTYGGFMCWVRHDTVDIV